MNQRDIIRAWKDPEAREAMAARGLDMPRHPAGIIELPDHLLGEASGAGTETMLSLGCCNGFTNNPDTGGCCHSNGGSCSPMGSGGCALAMAC